MNQTQTSSNLVSALPASQAFAQKQKVSIQVQSILYNNDYDSIARALESMTRSAELGIRAGRFDRVIVQYGDCSPTPCFDDTDLLKLQELCGDYLVVNYRFFGANLGSARGHNELAKLADTDFLVIHNPDVVDSPRLYECLVDAFKNSGVGMVEAKQLPIEHPKDYNASTGETSWASTACAMIPVSLFRQLDGFDADSFFLYCDDVDFSWRVRLSGHRVVFLPAAVVFHDKRISDTGAWQPTTSERYYSAEAALILAYKWSHNELAETIRKQFEEHGDDYEKKAAKEFERRKSQSALPIQIDRDHRIAQFSNGFYALHRYPL
jgi:GT2 family glycosyltransferase